MKSWLRQGAAALAVLACALIGMGGEAGAAGKILFVPHDNRPISCEQTVEVAERAGYEVELPPVELLGGREDLGHPDALLDWLEREAPTADAAVVASDSLIYGSLVGSRKHTYAPEELQRRTERFRRIRESSPRLRLYVFGSLMRTPASGEAAGMEEPAYYQPYGRDIFRTTALWDKRETSGLSRQEAGELAALEQRVPADVMADWLGRREKNFAVTKQLADYARQGIINYLIVGRDDNAPLCQTHRENRWLGAYAADIPKARFQSLAGIDEFGLLLLARAVNDGRGEVPFVYVEFNEGKGADTVPAYSDERIGDSVREEIVVGGGMLVASPARADFVLLVNTDKTGATGAADVRKVGFAPIANDGRARPGTLHFLRMVERHVAAGRPVGIADVAFGNGADNALMRLLHDHNLLYRLQAYSGWNTPTNSSGFAVGLGMMARLMDDEAKDRLLTRRYLDDWAYQANVRTDMAYQLAMMRGNAYADLGAYRTGIEARATDLMQAFAREQLPPFPWVRDFAVTMPWGRMFECRIAFSH